MHRSYIFKRTGTVISHTFFLNDGEMDSLKHTAGKKTITTPQKQKPFKLV